MPLTTIYGDGTRIVGDANAIEQTLHPTVMAYINIMQSSTGGNYAMTVNEIDAVNNMVQALVANGIWTKLQVLYPFIGTTAASQKFNLVDPRDANAAFRLSFLGGGWTHASTGAKPNGTTSYANTFYQPSVSATQNSHHLTYYSRTNSNAAEVEFGSASVLNRSFVEIRTSGITYFANNLPGLGATQFNDTDSLGFYINNRTSSLILNGWKNGIKRIDTTGTSGTPNVNNFYLGAYNNSGSAAFFSIKECALASIGLGLTDAEAKAFSSIVQAYQTKLGRQV